MWAIIDEVLDPILGLVGLVWAVVVLVGIRREIRKERRRGVGTGRNSSTGHTSRLPRLGEGGVCGERR